MANRPGDFIWYELMTNDADAAQDFYSAVLGWTFSRTVKSDSDYRQFSMIGVPVGGLLPLTAEMEGGGAQPCWTSYIAVDDVDRNAVAIAAAGGSVLTQPRDIPGIGRFSLVADPQAATFYIMKPLAPVGGASSQSFAALEPMDGHCAWNELATSDPAAALEFYHTQFGWEKDGEMDMGPLGNYEFLRHEVMIGAIMNKLPEMPASTWIHYFRVPDIDVALEKIKVAGGQVLQPPIEIPGDEYSLNAIDPQGAPFALVGKRPAL